MRAGVFMALATAVLGGCTAQMSTWLGSNQQPTTWLRLDKQQIVGNADLERQFAADEATCQGEVSKADEVLLCSSVQPLGREAVFMS